MSTPVEVAKSFVDNCGYDFAAAVEKHAREMTEHQLTEGVPAPNSTHAVVSAIARVPGGDGKPDTFVPNYVIVDDAPKLTLEQKRQRLMSEVSQWEIAQLHGIVPAGKRRFHSMIRQRLAAKGTEALTLEEARQLADLKFKDEQMQAVSFQAAKLHAEIEDIADGDIDAWKPVFTA